MSLPTPHLDKLQAALTNDKVPADDLPRIAASIVRYQQWIADMAAVDGDAGARIIQLTTLLTAYKRHVDLELIFDSQADFLYRQKGQLKLDNSIIEEFLPWLVTKSIPSLADFNVGPTNCYSAIVFEASLTEHRPGAGIAVRTKDQDFALSRRLFVKASHTPDFADAAQVDTYIAYVATEIKTNLDKTMFQEACATARDLRVAVPGARYYLMCEWLDMGPVSTAPTDIEEVLLLRGGKRLASNVRAQFSAFAGRRQSRAAYEKHLDAHPFRPDVFGRWANHLAAMMTNDDPIETDVLEKGYF